MPAQIRQEEIPEEAIDKCMFCFKPVIYVEIINKEGDKIPFPCEMYKVSLVDGLDQQIKIGYRSHYDVCEGYKNLDKTV